MLVEPITHRHRSQHLLESGNATSERHVRSRPPATVWIACGALLLAELGLLARGLFDSSVTEGFTVPELAMFSALFMVLTGLPVALLFAGVRWSRDLYIVLYGFTIYFAFSGIGPPMSGFEVIYLAVKLVAIVWLFRRTARQWLEPS